MSQPATSFTNPATATTYRLVVTDENWRVTKARDDDRQLKLVHLRGRVGVGAVDAAAVARLVAGEGGVAADAARPATVFAAVVLRDLDGTTTVLTAIAREAEEVYRIGCRGFRPRSPVLRQQRDAALLRATETCRDLAAAWRVSGLVNPREIPAWLAAALADEI